MSTFENLNLSKQLRHAIDDLGFDSPTPIQEAAFPAVLSGQDLVGIAQTGTGKTFAYMLPLLQQLKFSKQITPRILILVPTRELVDQLVSNIDSYTKYINIRVMGVYGESNINIQKQNLALGIDILVATPGRLYDLAISKAVNLRDISKLVIDEVDVMLDLGFRPQLINIFDLLPTRRQNIMFSATMTDEVDILIDDFFVTPNRIAIAVSGTPLENISQQCYAVKNFHTKANLLAELLADKETFNKVLVFVSSKSIADRLFDRLEHGYGASICIIHSNKSQNYRIRSVQDFEEGTKRILIATDVIARGLDLDKISHVINFDAPAYPENYMHRIGRTGRAAQKGNSLLFYTEKEEAAKQAIEELMKYKIPELDFPEQVEISNELIPEERPRIIESNYNRNLKLKEAVEPQEKLEKNKKVNLGGSYKIKLAEKYKKPRRRGDKNQNKNKKRR
ncbi:DEAD/DEAH box helicase [Reichenbachiella agarivorans]|uniref:DEAD/DEAH box helicase n=1 Tax=Reichenbachiella agarivorans TaxID=2979464 RepID=A0ABY6CQP3_9BACT|nr:DEAD/DEAH box helicase [Reichenbachiella agarivorans]UXP31763.1 DEAD/DEAH box helicase [Reichenbachiella agarivorans]